MTPDPEQHDSFLMVKPYQSSLDKVKIQQKNKEEEGIKPTSKEQMALQLNIKLEASSRFKVSTSM